MYNLGQYIHGDAITYKLDPRVKIMSVIALSTLIFRANLSGGAFISVFIVAVILISRLKINHILTALKPVAFFVALLSVVHVFFTDGTPVVSLSPFPVKITYEGLYQGAFVGWQIICLVLTAAVLTMTTSPSELVSGIENLLRPLRRVGVPSHDVAVMISMALRFMPTLLEEFDRIRMAQMARGADIKIGTILEKTRWAKALAIPLMVSAFRRADELADAMEARGYQRGYRTTLRELRMTPLDSAVMALMLLFMGGIFILTGISG
jgi:energy-coupling factor transporter transmembrane protein EcfT